MFLLPVTTYAQDRQGIVPCGPEEGGSSADNVSGCTLDHLFGLFVAVYNFLLGMAGIVALGFLIYGGIQMLMYSVDEDKLASGKKTVIEALIGLAIVALGYIVVNTLLSALGLQGEGFFNGENFFNGNVAR